MNPPPLTPPALPRRSGLAVASLVCGIFSILCTGILTGIPAVICGHIAQSKIKKSPAAFTGHGMALAGLIMGYISVFITLVVLPILAALAIPAILSAQARALATMQLNEARIIQQAIQQAAVDRTATGDEKIGFPADIKARSVQDVIHMLIKGGYISEEDAEHIHFEKFQIGNVSGTDAPDTILLLSKPSSSQGFNVYMLQSGDGVIRRPSQAGSFGRPAPRDPAFLPQE